MGLPYYSTNKQLLHIICYMVNKDNNRVLSSSSNAALYFCRFAHSHYCSPTNYFLPSKLRIEALIFCTAVVKNGTPLECNFLEMKHVTFNQLYLVKETSNRVTGKSIKNQTGWSCNNTQTVSPGTKWLKLNWLRALSV